MHTTPDAVTVDDGVDVGDSDPVIDKDGDGGEEEEVEGVPNSKYTGPLQAIPLVANL